MDCSRIYASDLIERYVAGRLDEPLAAELEAHYFGCDRCWARVRQATELRAGFDSEAAPPAPAHLGGGGGRHAGASVAPHRRIPARTWLAAAAVVAALGLGVWASSHLGGAASGADTLRGSAETLVLVASSTAGALEVRWSPVPGADSYQVRLFAPDGEVLLERTVADTAVSVLEPVGAAAAEQLYWQVEGYDVLRRRVAASAPTPARPARSGTPE